MCPYNGDEGRKSPRWPSLDPPSYPTIGWLTQPLSTQHFIQYPSKHCNLTISHNHWVRYSSRINQTSTKSGSFCCSAISITIGSVGFYLTEDNGACVLHLLESYLSSTAAPKPFPLGIRRFVQAKVSFHPYF